ncbi:MAG TPA: universal stress protein [Bacillota bacterium]|nr:universal stress protein [Bacillota bacterium]
MIPRSTQLSTGTDESRRSLLRGGRSSVQNILVPTKFSAASTRAVEQAVALARLVGAKLTLLHVIDIYGHPAWSQHTGSGEAFVQQLHAQANAQMERLWASLAGEPIQVETLIVEGLPAEEVVRRSHDFDLVIMGRPRSQHFWKLFNKKTAQRTIEEAECGVLVVHA